MLRPGPWTRSAAGRSAGLQPSTRSARSALRTSGRVALWPVGTLAGYRGGGVMKALERRKTWCHPPLTPSPCGHPLVWPSGKDGVPSDRGRRQEREHKVRMPRASLMWSTAAALCLAVGVALAGCDGTAQQGNSKSASPPASATTAAPFEPSAASTAGREAADRAAVEAAYRDFWVVSWTFDRHYPESQWAGVLGRVAAEPELSLILANTRMQRRHGITLYGRMVPHPTVQPINGAKRATVRDCQDAHLGGQADAKTGRPRTIGVRRNPVTAVLVRGSDGRWRVSGVTYPGGSC